MAEVPVNGAVLEWARKIRGLEVNSAAALLNVPSDELLAYEKNKKRPLVGLLRLMSDKYKINFASLLMPEPLPIEPPPADYRTGRSRQHLSMETLLAIEEVTEALEAFNDMSTESRKIIPLLGIGRAYLDEEPEVVAARERSRFGVSVEEQQTWKRGTAAARSQWRRHIESRGVFTYIISMPPDELSGFSMFRDGVAALCVNDSDTTDGRKIFTMFHEYAHLLLRRTGVSDENNSDEVERFCNQFAASFLVPLDSLVQSASGISDVSDSDVRRLASRFRVSNGCIALRLEKTGLAKKGFYARHTAYKWDPPEDEKKPVRLSVAGQPPKINYINIRLKRIGKLHARTVLRALDRNIINRFDASELIGVQPGSFPKVQAALEVQAALG